LCVDNKNSEKLNTSKLSTALKEEEKELFIKQVGIVQDFGDSRSARVPWLESFADWICERNDVAKALDGAKLSFRDETFQPSSAFMNTKIVSRDESSRIDFSALFSPLLTSARPAVITLMTTN
jgi:hypothetical protein